MPTYAAKTEVSAEKSLTEIRATLKRYESTDFAMIDNDQHLGIAFVIQGRRIRFSMPMPDRSEAVWQESNRYHRRGEYDPKLHDQLIRSRWRSLALVIKGKLESVALGVETLDAAFMAQLILPSGQTMEEWVAPQYETIFTGGTMPPLLPSGS